MASYELGYKFIIQKNFLVDAYVYMENIPISLEDEMYCNFDKSNPAVYRGISVVVNSDASVKTFGWAVSFDWRLPSISV